MFMETKKCGGAILHTSKKNSENFYKNKIHCKQKFVLVRKNGGDQQDRYLHTIGTTTPALFMMAWQGFFTVRGS